MILKIYATLTQPLNTAKKKLLLAAQILYELDLKSLANSHLLG